MLIPDVNLLVYAYNEDAPFHAAAKTWWETRLSEVEPVGWHGWPCWVSCESCPIVESWRARCRLMKRWGTAGRGLACRTSALCFQVRATWTFSEACLRGLLGPIWSRTRTWPR